MVIVPTDLVAWRKDKSDAKMEAPSVVLRYTFLKKWIFNSAKAPLVVLRYKFKKKWIFKILSLSKLKGHYLGFSCSKLIALNHYLNN